MAERRILTFKIPEAQPDHIAAGKLADYVKDLSALFGDEGVHLVEITGNSTDLAFLIDEESYPIVRQRISLVGTHDAPPDIARYSQAVEARLRRDEYSATLDEDNHKVLEFPGVRSESVIAYPPIIQTASLEGIPIRVGGKEEMVPVHFQDGETFHYCSANRAIAADIGEHLFKRFVRVTGEARWKRTIDGEWVRYKFIINSFQTLEDEPLTSVVDRLRSVPGSAWSKIRNATSELRNLRNGEP